MSNLKFFKELALPGTLEANSFYFIPSTGPSGGLFAEAYLTDSTGAARLIGSTAMIQEVANALMTTELEYAADIPARDALTLTQNSIVLVADASADPTVDAGAAMYFYQHATTTFIKVTEFESLDVVIDWTDVQNRPASTPAAIDQAVADSHTHANKAELDKISEDGNGCMLYDGEFPMAWSSTNW